MSSFFRPLKKPSISVLLGQFSLIAALLVGALLSFMLMNKFTTLLQEQQDKDIRNNISIIKQNIVSQLETYHLLLKDKSKTPLLVHALMHPGDYAGAAEDFLNKLTMFGNTEMIWLLNFEGQAIFEVPQAIDPFYGNEKWVEQMLRGEINSYQDLNAGTAGFFWRIATPVMYQDSPEGILVLELPVKRLLQESVFAGLEGIALNLSWNGDPAHVTGDENAKTLWGSEDFLPNAQIDFYFDERAIHETSDRLINELIKIILFSMVVLIVVFVWLGRGWFVSPIKRLSLMAHGVARGSKLQSKDHHAVAKEYQDLFTDFKEMSEKIEIREARLKEKNEALEKAKNSLEESQSHLVQSEKMVSIGMISAGVAHEINNPIGFIKSNLTSLNEYLEYLLPILSIIQKGSANNQLNEKSFKQELIELIEKDDLSFVIEDIDGLIKDAVDGTIRVQEIVAGLKSFARTNETDDVSFDLNECIRSTLKVVWNEVKYKARVDLDLKGIPAIKGNPGQINQVIMNLIVNAAQAIEKQGVINIQTELTDKNVVMRISDNGIGMSDQVMGSIFDPFFTTKDVGKGTGLGLSISHGIVESHGGSIHVESQVNEGTTFTLNFPIPQQHVAELEQVVNG